MPLNISSLNSGSNGNCYYIGNEREAILVDVGISCREIEKRLLRQGLSINAVKAIFISHEHSDHIKGLEVLSRKYCLPVHITAPTLKSGRLQLQNELVYEFKAYNEIKIGGLAITAFPKFHDASDPHSFIVSGNGVTIGVFTDIGSSCQHVTANFKQCHAVFLETNYDEAMLEEGNYPLYLKRRIRGTHGHLSNHQALELFTRHRSPFLSHLLLSHLSKENNSPQLVLNMFAEHAAGTKISVAPRDYETGVFTIGQSTEPYSPTRIEIVKKNAQTSEQMSLF